MKTLIQRVKSASVIIDGQVVGQIDTGVLAYVGIGTKDDDVCAKKLIDKILHYRIFENEQGKLDKSLFDVGGGLLIVSQFTLMATTNKGRRPDFGGAMKPDDAKVLYDNMVCYAKQTHCNVQTGQFGANMAVSSINDGPINFLIQVDRL